jgi:putative CocE/NonD family hydrolase
MRWGQRIPMRDGASLSATLYLPEGEVEAAPCLLTITPHTAHRIHPVASYFAACGYPFLIVDARGRGNSDGAFLPFAADAKDGYDIVEWTARQPFCNGRVAMFGSSSGGYNQWATVKEFPPHLISIIPVSACAPAIDFPMRNNIAYTWAMQWLTFTVDHTSQEHVMSDQNFWRHRFRQWFESGRPFNELDRVVGNPSSIFQEWISHAALDPYWDSLKPSEIEYQKLNVPILTITGSYDADQPGALHFYREHVSRASQAAIQEHYLVIGPWDLRGIFAPGLEIAGLKVGSAALVNVLKLCRGWYDWRMRGGDRPEFLRKRVSYYVTGVERWRYADTLESITARTHTLYLDSTGSASHVFAAGTLEEHVGCGASDTYVFDPRDTTIAGVESKLGDSQSVPPLRPTFATDSLTDQTVLYANEGKQLVYHSAPFAQELELSGFFKLRAWISIDQPDTDFIVRICEIGPDGGCVLLTTDIMRARYRESPRGETLIQTTEPLRYTFDRFTFISRQLKSGSRLRLVIGPINSMFIQRNYNSGGVVADECMRDAKTVTVTLWHDPAHPSALDIPLGQPISLCEGSAPASAFSDD